jgi:xanthine dehydrogenase YagS FAD-binding subunit
VLGPQPEDEAILPLDGFFRAPRHEGERETVLKPNQWVTHVVLPAAAGRQSATYEVRHGEGPDYPLAATAVALRITAGIVAVAKIVLGQVAPTPWLSPEAAAALVGRPISEAAAAEAGQAAVASATPLSGNEYKVQLAQVAVKRAVLLAAGLETGGF